MNERRKAYEEKIDAQLDEWKAQISLLKTGAEKAWGETKSAFNDAISKFK